MHFFLFLCISWLWSICKSGLDFSHYLPKIKNKSCQNTHNAYQVVESQSQLLGHFARQLAWLTNRNNWTERRTTLTRNAMNPQRVAAGDHYKKEEEDQKNKKENYKHGNYQRNKLDR